MLHGPDGEVETVVDDQAVRLGRRREGRNHVGRGSRLWSSVRASWRELAPRGSGLGPSYSYVTRKFWVALSLNGGRDVRV